MSTEPYDPAAAAEELLAYEPMHEDQLRGIVAQEIQSGLGGFADTLSADRATSMREYLGEPYGDEREGYSAVVSRDTFETVESILPDLCETFVGGDEVVRVEPSDEKDEETAKQATARLNHAFLRENPGFLLAYSAMKDALLQRTGVWKWWVEETQEVDSETLQNLGPTELGMLIERGAKIVALEQDPTTGLAVAIVESTKTKRRVCIAGVPPEEFIIDRDATTITDARCVGHITTKTVSELLAMGYDSEKVAQCPGPNSTLQQGDEESARRELEGSSSIGVGNIREGSEAQKEIAEVYIRVDYDGDGRSELRRIVCGGVNAAVIFENEPAESVQMAAITPIIITHRFFGMSIADALSDLQKIRTVLTRQYLDALYLKNNPRSIVSGSVDGGPFCDVDELQNTKPGGWVTEYQPGAIRPFVTEDATSPALQGLEYTRGLREERIGVSRASTGMAGAQADEITKLHGTAKGLGMLQAAANKRVALIARVFAETGFKDLFHGLYKALRQIDEPATFQHKGQWNTVGREAYEKDRTCVISVGLGYGDRRERAEALMAIASLQERIGAAGLGGTLVSPENVYNLADEMSDVLGYRNADRFFTNPKTAPPREPPPPEAWVVEVAAKERMHAEDLRLKELEIRLDFELELRKLGLKEAEAEAEALESPLPITGTLEPSPQSQRAAEPGGGRGNGGLPA